MADFLACSYCGSPRVYPKIWVQGFLAGINDERRTYVCRDCGREGIALFFESDVERERFAAEKRGGPVTTPVTNPPPTDAIPILPIDAVPLVQIRGVDAVPIYRTKVVDVAWDDGKLHRGGYRMDVDVYWGVVGGPRYNAERLFVLDLAGINHRDPNFDALRKLGKRATLLLDLGAREADDVMDGLMVDVESIVAGTKTLDRIERFQEIRELSDGVLPCVDLAGGVMWSPLARESRDLRGVTAVLREYGFERLAVMDLPRLGTFRGPDPTLLAALDGLDFDVFLGGGIREEDVPGLREKGFQGALIDPYTPVIRDLLPTEKEAVPADATPTPSTKRDSRGTPSPV